jgi:hypothetical protein
VLCLNPRLGSGSEEPLDSFVSKPLDRHACKCNLYGYRTQPAARHVACIAPRHHLNRVAPASALAKKTVSAFLDTNPSDSCNWPTNQSHLERTRLWLCAFGLKKAAASIDA